MEKSVTLGSSALVDKFCCNAIPEGMENILSFVSVFFTHQKVVSPTLALALRKRGDHVFLYLPLQEILNLSVCSRFSASLEISVVNVQRLLNSNKKISHIGSYKLSVSTAVSLGIFRRMLSRVVQGREGVLSIDNSTGRIMLDVGSAFKDRDAFLAAATSRLVDLPVKELTGQGQGRRIGGGLKEHKSSNEEEGAGGLGEKGAAGQEKEEEEEDHPIFEQLESGSFDEYDDFNPRHPVPRECMAKVAII